MSQSRYNIYGSMVETADTPTVIQNIFSPCRLTGCSFRVLGADLLGVEAGSCLMPDGVLIVEDTEKQLVVPNSSSAVDYTVIYQLEDTRVLGGSPANLRIVSGTSRQEDLTDATILGWIRYTGNSAPLSDSMFIQPTSLRIVPQTNTLSFSTISPFPSAIRPTAETLGSTNIVSIPVANVQLGQLFTKALNSVSPSRITGVSISSDFGIPSSQTNYMTYSVKNGTDTLYSFDTRQIAITADSPTPFLRNSALDFSRFIFDTSSSPTITSTRVGMPSPTVVGDISISPTLTFTKTGGTTYLFSSTDLLKYLFFRSGANTGAVAQIVEIISSNQVRLAAVGQSFSGSTSDVVEIQNTGELVFTVETPASSGNWTETVQTLNNERVNRFSNISPSTQVYLLQFPFIIASEGQPRKLISRLLVDFSCIVTLRLRVQGQVITLSPSSGVVSNTATLITSELDIPTTTSVSWTAGSTGVIEAEINAQSGRGASFAFFALVQEPTPFKIFA